MQRTGIVLLCLHHRLQVEGCRHLQHNTTQTGRWRCCCRASVGYMYRLALAWPVLHGPFIPWQPKDAGRIGDEIAWAASLSQGPQLVHGCWVFWCCHTGCLPTRTTYRDRSASAQSLLSHEQCFIAAPTWSSRSFARASTSSSCLAPPLPEPLLPAVLLPPVRGARLIMPPSSTLLSSMR